MIQFERIYTLVLMVAGSISIVMGLFVLWRRRAPGAKWMAMVMFTSSIWMIGYALELRSETLSELIFWGKVQYFGIATVPTVWFISTLRYTGRDRWLTQRKLPLLGLVPALTIAIALTNERHGLLWAEINVQEVGPLLALDNEYGPALWLFATYSYLLVLAASIIMIQMVNRSNRFYRSQLLANIAAAAAPWLASIHDLLHLPPLPMLDFAPMAFTLTSFILTWNVVGWRMTDLLPVARGTILESMDDGVIVLDPLHRIVDLNAVAAALIGRSAQETIGSRLISAWPELANATVFSQVTPDAPCEFTLSQNHGEAFFDVRVSSIHADESGGVGHVIVLRDATERIRAEAALRESEARYALAAEGANDGLWDWDLQTDEIYFSPRWKSMLGFDEGETFDQPDHWLERVHPEDRVRLRREIEAHLAGETPHFESEYRIRNKAGEIRWMLSRAIAVRDDAGVPERMAGSQTDITDRKTAERQLIYQALHDDLTGLPNRTLLMERLDRALERVRRDSSTGFAVLFLDLDRFKVINDSLGHLAGDDMLVSVAERLGQSMRTADTVARHGGDEFVILLESIYDPKEAILAAERIQDELGKPFRVSDQEVFTSASIGIALSSADYEHPDDLLRDADIAMYRAKAHGNARCELFNAEMHTHAVALLQLETDLRQALERREFELYFQPIQSLNDSAIVGFEALLRWRHPRRGLLRPQEFLGVAEETGLIVPIGAWVLQEACRIGQEWRESLPNGERLSMSVNLSANQLRHPHIVATVQDALVHSGLPSEHLQLEITESTVIQDGSAIGEVLDELRALGVNIHIDDFGTGYSSLGILHRLPVDILKIDQSFIQRMSSEQKIMEIVRAILALARGLNIGVIAEGIETRPQLEILRDLECAFGQGYLLTEPIPAEAVRRLHQDLNARTDGKAAVDPPAPPTVPAKSSRKISAR